MPGLCGYIGEAPIEQKALEQSIDLLSNCHTQTTKTNCGLISASFRGNSLFSSSSVFVDPDWSASFSGDLVDFSRVPWRTVLPAIRQGRYEEFNKLIGVFCFAVLDKMRRKLVLITDQIGQAPLFFNQTASTFTFSTSIATFCQLTKRPNVNAAWIYEFMYFNYAVGSTSILENVFRMPPASALEVDIDTLTLNTIQFGGPMRYSDSSKRWTRDKRIRKTIEVLESRIPRYYITEDRQAVSLTAGCDSRTVLAFAPQNLQSHIETYTYGVPGCWDLENASKTAKGLQLTHHQIAFDARFLANLDQTLDEAVFLSGGLERANRSTLLHVYRTLTKNGARFPVVITGISGDHLFRDHLMGSGNVPSLISADMMSSIHSGSVHLNEDLFRRTFGNRYSTFRDYIYAVVESLNRRYGNLSTPVGYQRFLIFEVGPKYFVGETVIGNHFTAVRSPYWDSHLHELIFELDYSTLGFSKIMPNAKDPYRECVLQACAIAKGGSRHIKHVKGIPIWSYSIDNKLVYLAAKTASRGPNKLRKLFTRRDYVPLENWTGWFNSVLRNKFLRLLGDNNRISEYVDPGFVNEVKNGSDIMLLQRLVTSELVLRLVANDWKMPFDGQS